MNINNILIHNFRKMCFYFVLLMLYVTFSECTHSNPQEFYSLSTLEDGVHELLLQLNGIKVQETIAGPKEGSHRGIVVRQLTNGRQVVNLIYNGIPPYLQTEERYLSTESEESSLSGPDGEKLELRECRVEKNLNEVDEFIRQFDTKVNLLKDISVLYGIDRSLNMNASYVSLENIPDEEIEDYLKSRVQFRYLKHKCFELHRKLRKYARAENRSLKHNLHNTSTLQRRRRGLNELLILPGTKWCGNGRLAKSYNDLDGYMVADHCCRDHDLCPSSIPRMSRKFGLYNYRLSTISHCSCDKRFKTCLKQTGTGAADVVGNVFFSIVKSSCFDFKLRRVCRKRDSRSCRKWVYEKQAVIRNPISWNSYARNF